MPLESLVFVLAQATLVAAIDSQVAAHPKLISLDTQKIHAAFEESEFGKVIELAGPFNENKYIFTYSDSVFILKRLSVVHLHDSDKRELGRRYLHRLFTISSLVRNSPPHTAFIELKLPPKIEDIIEKDRESFNISWSRSQANLKSDPPAADTHVPGLASPNSTAIKTTEKAPIPVPSKQPNKTEKGINPWYLVGGGGFAVLVAAGYFAFSNQEPTKKSQPSEWEAQVVIPQE